MADPRAFISFDYDHDDDQRMLFVGQSKNSKTPFDIEDWSSKSKLPQDEWEKEIATKIKRCHLMVVLVGKNMPTANGVLKEIRFARDGDVPYFGVYVHGANSESNLPTGLARNRTISWTWEGISKAIDQMMTEGKNKNKK